MKRFQSFLLAAIFGLTLFVTSSYSLPTIAQIIEPAPTEALPVEESTQEPVLDGEESVVEEADSPEKTPDAAPDPRLTQAERIRRKLLIQGDVAYAAGDIAAARSLYQQAKDQSWLLPHRFETALPEPFTDEAMLSPGGAVFWREAQAGIENERPSQTLVALELLSEREPAFILGHLKYSDMLQADGQYAEADAALEAALTQYPAQTDLLLAQVDLRMSQSQWLEAAIASRQFVALNREHEDAPEQKALADQNLERFQSKTRGEIREGAIANVFTGIASFALTGSIFGPFTAANSAVMLMQGENSIGNRFAGRIEQQLPMLQHPEALGYIRRIGNRLAAATGRSDLDYEFFVILDPNLNAFALPGGKIFINAGAILDTNSEAEIAGLLAHELSHSVLSHGFQIATRGNLSSSVAQFLPYGGLINNVFMSGYSRDMERQADIVGTQILAAGGYAADGLHNVMITLNEQNDGPRAPAWISSHPNPEDRVAYLQNLVERGGYNRFAYEGVATHEEIQAIVARELAAYEAEHTEDTKGDETQEEPETSESEATDLYDAVEKFDW